MVHRTVNKSLVFDKFLSGCRRNVAVCVERFAQIFSHIWRKHYVRKFFICHLIWIHHMYDIYFPSRGHDTKIRQIVCSLVSPIASRFASPLIWPIVLKCVWLVFGSVSTQ